MQIKKEENYTSIIADENDFNSFFSNLENEFDTVNETHIILNLDNSFTPSLNELLSLISISETQRDNNLSLIIISKGIAIDDIPDEISIAPTFKEAIDTLEMENIQRELLSGLGE